MKRASQEKERERQFEWDKQERELQRELQRDQEKHRQEMEKIDFQAKIREQEARATEEGRRQSEGNGDEVPIKRAIGKVPKLSLIHISEPTRPY